MKIKRGDIMSNDADQNNNIQNQYGTNKSNNQNIPDMSDWDKPAGNEDLKLAMLNESKKEGSQIKEV